MHQGQETEIVQKSDQSLESSWGALSDGTNNSFSIQQFQGNMHFQNFSQ
jgi:RNase P/RNase MRP subunit p29